MQSQLLEAMLNSLNNFKMTKHGAKKNRSHNIEIVIYFFSRHHKFTTIFASNAFVAIVN